MSVVACEIPVISILNRHSVDAAFFRDSYSIPMANADNRMTTIFFAIFGHLPKWIKAALIARNRIAAQFELEVPQDSEILNPTEKDAYQVGDTIGPWPIYGLTQTELVAGRNNKHLDFRLSILKTTSNDVPSVVVSTICNVHNLSGKIYLFFIVPFHKWGLKRLLADAIASGRI